jgi:hypothetical protein
MSIDDVRTAIGHLDDRERVRCRALMMQRLRTRARALGLDPAIVTQLTTPMVDAFIDLQHRASPATPARVGTSSVIPGQ